MEARSLSECGALSSWALFEVKGAQRQHVIGYSPHYGFDVITQELAFFEYDKRNKSGRAITQAGVLYRLEGRPVRLSFSAHPQLREFMQINDCDIRILPIR